MPETLIPTAPQRQRRHLEAVPAQAPARRRRPDPLWAPLAIRLAVAADTPSLWRLAALDSARPPVGTSVVAEQGGSIVAAVSLDGWTAIANPFIPTADILAMLQLRAAQLRRAGLTPEVAA